MKRPILDPVDPDAPYALASLAERQRRVSLLFAPHMKPLTAHLATVSEARGRVDDLPALDQCDGGIAARVLLLLEAPGPKAVASGFVSRNNPDPTAKNLCELLRDAGIPRTDTAVWNICPWYVGDGRGRIRPVTPADIAEVRTFVPGLLACFPSLEHLVLVGRKAQSAEKWLRELTNAAFWQTYHPSGQVLNGHPERRTEILETLKAVSNAI
ncbi:MAG: uracil-DNA glycosylase [Armatimonadetes bacterium]|nr:uracil-DNA glycosylase [Armatimonadota bacterium]